MARGWESKAVEAQQEQSAERSRTNPKTATAEEIEKRARRATLQLARARAAADLQRARTTAHKQMLQQALDALDRQLSE